MMKTKWTKYFLNWNNIRHKVIYFSFFCLSFAVFSSITSYSYVFYLYFNRGRLTWALASTLVLLSLLASSYVFSKINYQNRLKPTLLKILGFASLAFYSLLLVGVVRFGLYENVLSSLDSVFPIIISVFLCVISSFFFTAILFIGLSCLSDKSQDKTCVLDCLSVVLLAGLVFSLLASNWLFVSDLSLNLIIAAIIGIIASCLLVNNSLIGSVNQALSLQGILLYFQFKMKQLKPFVNLTHAPVTKDKHLLKTAIILFIATVGLFVFRLSKITNHDVGYFIYKASLILKGQSLYTDFIDLNPPMIWGLNILSQFLFTPLSINLEVSWILFWCCVFFTTLLLSFYIMRDFLTHRVSLVFLCFLFLVFGFLYPYSFAQREHFFTLFCLPYIFLFIKSQQGLSSGRVLSIASGLLFFVGVSLKPYFYILPFCMFVYNWINTKSWRVKDPGFLIFCIVSVFYILSIALFFPIYFKEIVPIALSTYSYWKEPEWYLTSFENIFAILSFVSISIFVLRKGKEFRITKSIIPMAFSGLIIYFLQGIGWSYHFMPFIFFMMILLFVFLLKVLYIQKITASSFAFYGMFVMLLISFCMVFVNFAIRSEKQAMSHCIEQIKYKKSILKSYQAKSFYSLSIGIGYTYPLALQVKSSTYRSPFWFIPYLLENTHLKNTSFYKKINAIQQNAIIREIIQTNPDIIFYTKNKGKFDVMEFFKGHAVLFEILNKYKKINRKTKTGIEIQSYEKIKKF